MSGFEEFGIRIQKLRKDRNMTQEELADRLGVTSQAVSKWETGLSYPDITLIPVIAEIFAVETDFLFGKIRPENDGSVRFPETLDGLKLIHTYKGAACYSEKQIVKTDGSGVKFTDGSTAELSSGLVTNCGKGEVRVIFAENFEKLRPAAESGKTILEKDFGYTDSADVSVISNNCTIAKSNNERTQVYARGDAEFIALLDIGEANGTVYVKFKEDEDYNFEDSKNNIVKILLPVNDIGGRVDLKISGSGNAKIDLDFNEASFKISGSGGVRANNIGKSEMRISGSGSMEIKDSRDVDMRISGSGAFKINNCEGLTAKISGSGAISCENTGEAEISISGSGAFSAESIKSVSSSISGSGNVEIGKLMNGEVNFKISGSGGLKINEGNCGNINIDASGDCNIDAAGLTARKATIILKDKGKVIIGRVTESSTEQIKKKGTIKILQRGV